MAKAPQAPTAQTPSRATASHRPARVTRDGSETDGGAPSDEAKVVLTREDFRRIGETLNGSHWQSDVARDIGCSKSQITRYLDTSGNPRTSRVLTVQIAEQLQHVIVQRIGELVDLFNIEGMPHANTTAARMTIDEIKEALERVPGREPPRHRPPA